MICSKGILNDFLCNITTGLYTINQYRSNFDYDKTPDGVDASGNF
jgi:hypothetical protein